jgi:hypothetical protein
LQGQGKYHSEGGYDMTDERERGPPLGSENIKNTRRNSFLKKKKDNNREIFRSNKISLIIYPNALIDPFNIRNYKRR